jgi:hypothetical protein
MKTVNLLPDWYLQQQRQRRNMRLHLIVMMMVGAGMVASMGLGRARLAQLDEQRRTLANQVGEVGNLQPELEKRQAALKRVLDVQAAYEELGNTVPMSAVIQQIQNDMKPGMALSRVAIDVRSQPIKGSGFVGDTKHPPRYHDVAYLTVVGIAPNDVQIAQFIGKMSANPLFGECSLNFTRTDLIGDYIVRRFEIQMQMDLEPLATELPDETSDPTAVANGGPIDAR